MSYCRWSTILRIDGGDDPPNIPPPPTMPGPPGPLRLVAEDLEQFTEANAEWQQRLPSHGACVSQWYIFWHTDSDDSLGRNGQLLAMWHVGGAFPLIDYQELRRIADRETWELIPGYGDTTHNRDQDNVRRCVRRWLSDVEAEHPETDPLVLQELDESFHALARRATGTAEAGVQSTLMAAQSTADRTVETADRAAADNDPEL